MQPTTCSHSFVCTLTAEVVRIRKASNFMLPIRSGSVLVLITNVAVTEVDKNVRRWVMQLPRQAPLITVSRPLS
jgi:hypothetical protein